MESPLREDRKGEFFGENCTGSVALPTIEL
jgi:hypothetical protein